MKEYRDTPIEDLHRRFDLLERMINENQQTMTARMARGFKRLHPSREKPATKAQAERFSQDAAEELEKKIRELLKHEGDVFLKDLKDGLPRELSRLVRQGRLVLALVAFLLMLSLGLNGFFYWTLKTEIVNRTPTRMQIEMMKIGWKELQKQETGGEE
ncbi:hypothetical protein [Acanthopleuribacter pedis]|uniref:Uncharacterized protein n=1 Tax=Acanthopleuribacter pedis TaxID=442870 RepID=A0A8J7QRP2_9BACT|nr:hypothetical protein [Acanthopleuribacter pedis]MBO1323390.1 hypothetical protein [Acanthopleuribacter pedis]